MELECVWFKKDLRIHDHRPLADAAAQAARHGGGVLCAFVLEDEWLASPETDGSHVRFLEQCLSELDAGLARLGGRLLLLRGDLPAAFEDLRRRLAEAGIRIARLHSHEETTGLAQYRRDQRVRAWADRHGIPWHETPQTGVVRRIDRVLGGRDGWAKHWEQRMTEPVAGVPRELPAGRLRDWSSWPTTMPGACVSLLDDPDVRTLLADRSAAKPAGRSGEPAPIDGVQPGGRAAAEALLGGFLSERGVGYRRDMSSPVAGWHGCSRLSAHLAFGTISIRETFQALTRRRAEIEEARRAIRSRSAARGVESAELRRWGDSLASFAGRLRWHCHFIQKLEDEPAIEHRNMNRAYDGMRTEAGSPEELTGEELRRFEAWIRGQTGYPMVDACMRCLHATGWVNFRMRAMLASFAAYHLWLHWRPSALALARHFLDFEPGIHYCQFQMQSGTTGINTVRIYSPIKQVADQDPAGVFIRRWVPELAEVPDEHLAEPHLMPGLTQHMAGCEIHGPYHRDDPTGGGVYPAPIVVHRTACAEAKERVFSIRKGNDARTEAVRVYARHGSRRRPGQSRWTHRGRPDDRGGAREHVGA